MSTLLFTLAGPQQAWGSRSRFATRASELAPTRSGVIGLFAAALGLSRSDPLTRFDDLEFGVRVDQPGRLERDFQTARTLDGQHSMPLSHRFYLADAVFVAGLASSDEGELKELSEALRRPVFPLFLGRRAFPPSLPVRGTLVDEPLREALRQAPWQATRGHQKATGTMPTLELYVDARADEPADLTLRDIPRSFDPRRRLHDQRRVRVLTTHDPMTLVSDEEV